jgi:hypothetical protein
MQMDAKHNFNHIKSKNKQCSKDKKSITIKVPAELKKQIDNERKLTGQTIAQIVEKAIANLLNSDQTPSSSNSDQELQSKQLREVASDLRLIVHKLDKIAAKQASPKIDVVNLVVVGNRHPSLSDSQKERMYALVKAMHRVGANLSMIAAGLNIEGIKKDNHDGRWQARDVEKILYEIKQENDYLPPIYTLPEES